MFFCGVFCGVFHVVPSEFLSKNFMVWQNSLVVPERKFETIILPFIINFAKKKCYYRAFWLLRLRICNVTGAKCSLKVCVCVRGGEIKNSIDTILKHRIFCYGH